MLIGPQNTCICMKKGDECTKLRLAEQRDSDIIKGPNAQFKTNVNTSVSKK